MKTERHDYLVNAGPAKDDLRPCCAYRYKEDAIQGAKNLEAEKIKKLSYIEVVFMPEDDDDINEVVWKNFE